MSVNEIVNLIVAIVVSAPIAAILAQAIRRAGWSSALTFAVVSVVCYAVGIAQTWAAGTLTGLIDSWGDLTATQIIAWGAAVQVAAVVEYEASFKGLPWMGALLDWPSKR